MYVVHISRTAERQLKKLGTIWQRRVAATITSLEVEPRPYGCRKLSGFDNTYRVRVGDYRISYDIEDTRVTVTVLKVAHRRDVYR